MESVPLRCPNCGGQIDVLMDWHGSGYSSFEKPSGFECDGCWSAWNLTGVPTQEPKWILYPDAYRRPSESDTMAINTEIEGVT